jgi:hypothetical protein
MSMGRGLTESICHLDADEPPWEALRSDFLLMNNRVVAERTVEDADTRVGTRNLQIGSMLNRRFNLPP